MAEQVNYFRGAIETLTYTVAPTEEVKAGQLINFKGGVAKAGEKVHGVAAHDVEAQDFARGLRIVVVGQVDLAAGGKIAQGDDVSAGEGGLPVSGGVKPFGTALCDAAAGERVAILISPR